MFTIDLYTSYTALLTVFTTIQRIFAQKYISESLFMNISGKKKLENSDAAHWLDHFQNRLSVGLNCFGIRLDQSVFHSRKSSAWTAKLMSIGPRRMIFQKAGKFTGNKKISDEDSITIYGVYKT